MNLSSQHVRIVGPVPFLAFLGVVVQASDRANIPVLPLAADSIITERNDETDAVPHEFVQPFNERFESALSERQFQEAEVIAKQLIELLLENAPTSHAAMAKALGDLATVQRLTEQYAAAAQNYEAAIEIVEGNEDRLSPGLLEPLNGLAQTYRARGNAAGALDAYDRALHISHVNEGPHSLRQADILNAMVDVNIEAGKLDAALVLLDRMNILYEREFSPYSIELLPVLNRRADLFRKLRKHDEERQVYRRIVSIMSDEVGEDSLALIEPYMKFAQTYLHEADRAVYRSEPTTETGETYLRKALEIAQSKPDADWQILEQCLLTLGDYYMIHGANDLAIVHYRRAWELTTSHATIREHPKKNLEQPVVLRRTALGQFADFSYGWDIGSIDPKAFRNGHIVARYTVTNRGRATDIEIVDADPEDFTQMEFRVRHNLRSILFRPRFADGEPVDTVGIVFRHDYRYVPSDLAGN